MRGHRRSVVPVIIALATTSAGFAIVPASGAAHAAAACLGAPKSAPPQGQHWYYRTDRALSRKCWFLASQDRDAASEAASRAAATKPAKPVAAPAPQDEARTDDTQPLVTKEAADVAPDDALVLLPPEPKDTPAAAATGQPSAQPPAVAAAPGATAQQPAAFADATPPADQSAPPPAAVAPPPPVTVAQPQPAAAAPSAIAAPQPAAPVAEAASWSAAGMFQWVFLALAAIGLLAGAIFYIRDIRRRRSDVLNVVASANTAPRAAEPRNAAPRNVRLAAERPAPRLKPADPGDQVQDDIESLVQGMAQMRRRRAA